jgi:hypothetical protein
MFISQIRFVWYDMQFYSLIIIFIIIIVVVDFFCSCALVFGIKVTLFVCCVLEWVGIV